MFFGVPVSGVVAGIKARSGGVGDLVHLKALFFQKLSGQPVSFHCHGVAGENWIFLLQRSAFLH